MMKTFGDFRESLWANIHKKRQRIKRGSGEKMRKKGEKGAPTPAQMKRAKGEEIGEKAPDTSDAMKRYKAGKAGFTDKAHLKAKGLIPRSDGTKRKSPKYEAKVMPKVKKKLDKIKGITKQQAEILASIPQPTLMTIIQQLSTLTMELDPKKDDGGDYIDDFRQSDAPQFNGKSDAKIRKMAIAAYLAAKDKK